MRFIKCDRCGETTSLIDNDLWKVITIEHTNYDLCPACFAEFGNFMGEREQPKPEPVPVKSRKVDTGKLQALADAGWTVKAIADEMGVSQQALYNHLGKRKAE